MTLQTAQARKRNMEKVKSEYDAKLIIQVWIKEKRKFGIGHEVMRHYR